MQQLHAQWRDRKTNWRRAREKAQANIQFVMLHSGSGILGWFIWKPSFYALISYRRLLQLILNIVFALNPFVILFINNDDDTNGITHVRLLSKFLRSFLYWNLYFWTGKMSTDVKCITLQLSGHSEVLMHSKLFSMLSRIYVNYLIFPFRKKGSDQILFRPNSKTRKIIHQLNVRRELDKDKHIFHLAYTLCTQGQRDGSSDLIHGLQVWKRSTRTIGTMSHLYNHNGLKNPMGQWIIPHPMEINPSPWQQAIVLG